MSGAAAARAATDALQQGLEARPLHIATGDACQAGWGPLGAHAHTRTHALNHVCARLHARARSVDRGRAKTEVEASMGVFDPILWVAPSSSPVARRGTMGLLFARWPRLGKGHAAYS